MQTKKNKDTTPRKKYYGGYNVYDDKPSKKRKQTISNNYLFAPIRKYLRNLLYPKHKKNTRYTIIWTYCITIFILATIIFSLTRKNAYGIYFKDQFICNIALDKTVTPEYLDTLISKKIESEVGSSVKLKETLTYKKVHSSKKDIISFDVMAGKVYRKFTYQVAGTAIMVNNHALVTLKNEAQANELINKIKERFTDPKAKITSTEFVDPVSTKALFVDPKELNTPEDAYKKLTATNIVHKSYIVKKNDSLFGIAKNHQMTLEQLLDANAGFTDKTIIQPGQEIYVNDLVPLISVISREELKSTKTIPRTVEKRTNPFESKTYEHVLQEGKDGQIETVIEITKLNGTETERKLKSETTLVEAVSRIIEVGTR